MARLTSYSLTSNLFVLACTLLVSGCSIINGIGPNCDRSAENNPPVKYTEGTTENGVYMSSPWEGELLWFPGGMRYELEHELGEVPRFADVWLSFDRCGTKSSTVARASGNQAEMRMVDQEKLVVVNGSCSDYWLLVVAGTGTSEPGPPETGVSPGTSDGACDDNP